MTPRAIIQTIQPAFILIGLLLGSTPSQGQSWLTNGLVAYYPFNGNANDVSGNQNHGTNNGALLTEDRFGNPLSAFRFSGNVAPESNIKLPSPQLNVPFPRTVSVWFKLSSGTQAPRIASTAGWELTVNLNANGLQTININTATLGGGDSLFSSPLALLGNYHHAVAIWTSSNGVIYLDGRLFAQKTWSTLASNDFSRNFVPELGGNSGAQWDAFGGHIDDVRIYNRALSAKEVASLYFYESQKQVQLVKYYNLDFDGLLLGRNYQLQASTNLLTWTNWGTPFTATSDTYTNTIPYQRVEDWSKVFFRLQQQ